MPANRVTRPSDLVLNLILTRKDRNLPPIDLPEIAEILGWSTLETNKAILRLQLKRCIRYNEEVHGYVAINS